MNKEFTCRKCSNINVFGSYVFAHWDELLVHTCSCGEKSDVFRGRVTPFEPEPEKAPRRRGHAGVKATNS